MECSRIMETKIQARIDSDLKIEGEQILKKLGMTTTELMRMTFRQLVMRMGCPSMPKFPTKKLLLHWRKILWMPNALAAWMH